NFNGKEDPLADWTDNMTQASQGYFGKSAQGVESSEHLQFWIGFSTACGSFYQFQLMKDSTALWGSAIDASEQAVFSGNSLSDLCTKNSVSVSLLESVIEGKRHCGVFIDIPLCEIDRQATAATVGTLFYYKIPNDITFSGVLDLNKLNPIFNSFPVFNRNFATIDLQLWIQDFQQDLKVAQLNKNDTIQNNHLAYHMIPPEKPDIVYLLSGDDADGLSYKRYNVRIVNMQNAANGDKIIQNSISQIGTAKFDILEIQNVYFNIQNEEAITSLIQQQKIINFPTQVFRTQSSNFPFSRFDRNSGLMQSIMLFSNIKALFMTFAMLQYPTWFFSVLFSGQNLVIDQNNAISQPGNKAIRTLYPSKFILAWKLATDYSFRRGYNSINLGSRTNNKNDFKQFIGTRAYPDLNKVSITSMMHYLCDVFVRIIFDDSSMPYNLNIDVIGEFSKVAIQPQ
ncbi:MAG: hypothetical protein EZS28_035856, partial [Streblomastix strix]